jgi:predicted ATPase
MSNTPSQSAKAAPPASGSAAADAGAAAAPAGIYRARESNFQRMADAEGARSRQLSTLRLLLLVGGVAALIAAIAAGWRDHWRPGVIGAGVAGAAFLIVAILHDRVEQRRRRFAALAAVNRDAQHRLARRWSALPDPPAAPFDDDHPYALDLDVVGHASLYQLLGPPNTPPGRATLTRWLLRIAEAEPDHIAARQAAVRELTPAIDLRQELHAAGLDAARVDERALEQLLSWAEGPPALARQPIMLWSARLLTVATPLLAAAGSAGLVSPSLWLLTAGAGWLVMFRVSAALNAAFEAASCEHALRTFERLLAVLAPARFEAPLLADAHRALVSERGSSAHRALGALHQIVALTDFRHTPLFYFPMQTFFMWDLHVWWGLERWQQKHGKELRGWLEAAGQVEALSALASLAHAQPAWIFPEVRRIAQAQAQAADTAHGDARAVVAVAAARQAGAAAAASDAAAAVDAASALHAAAALDNVKVEARRLGHPLLADAVRVPNDVTVGPPGTFLLITGSNMSGKSTLLRAVGLNAVLAHAGGPVCAERLTLPPLTLRTSMRVSDSLERGLSLFMASLLRLERVVSAARAANPRTRPLLYLLDEVLQGTNSAERQIAVRTIVQHLLRCGAIGVVTTHDLELAAAPDFAAHADSRHLTETLTFVDGEVKMTFDHTLRPGPARSGNALQLLRSLGLDADTLDRVMPPDPGR